MAEFFGELLDRDAAVRWRQAARERGERVVFTNGCFDVLHAGHVEYLAWAREQGDRLVLGLNSDRSVRELKGERRPIVTFEDRARLLCALRSVDVVVGFDERTPEVLIDHLAPDVFVKSSQYTEDELPERTVVRAHGGVIRLAPHRAGTSTTDTIGRIIQRYGSEN